MAAKCTNCLRGARATTTGVNPSDRTLKLDMGGAVLYVMPRAEGGIEVCLNSESLLDGNFLCCIWDGERWII